MLYNPCGGGQMFFVLCVSKPTAASLTLQTLIYPRQGLMIATRLNVCAPAPWASSPVTVEPAIYMIRDKRP